MKKYSKGAAGTFALNKGEPIHRWYSYIEGYSSCLIQDLIDQIGVENIGTIYDPFGGTGTTPLVASQNGIKAYYSETNPFMCEVIESKINCVKRLRDSGIRANVLRTFLQNLENNGYQQSFIETDWDGFEKFFDPPVLCVVKTIYELVSKIKDDDSRKIAYIALASVLVRGSNMIRQGDLRFAKTTEKTDTDKDVFSNFLLKLKDIIDDIENDDCKTITEAICLNPDARKIDCNNIIDCVITSPPYLNGTNYIRNTKLELKLLGFIRTANDLPEFHSKGIIAGINNVSKRNSNFAIPACALEYINQLEPVAYDKRIPIMVGGYFSDMSLVIQRLASALKDNGLFIMDIGDSQFAGVHIPTHEILSKICVEFGFEKIGEEILRERRSKNGMVLSQRLLKFRLHKVENKTLKKFQEEAENFIAQLPYKHEPYSGRNWGHSWHSLCSYHGKLKPAIAHFLVSYFTNPGDTVLDPLSGVGTIPLEACLQGRIGIGNDLSELAYTVSKAKLEKCDIVECENVLKNLNSYIEIEKNSSNIEADVLKFKKFGFNGKIPEYFHGETFKEILAARKYFISRLNTLTAAEAMIFSCFLHVLHGNRPYALSRNSHPLTPYAPKGEFVYKNVVEHIKDKLKLAYKSSDFDQYVQGKAYFGDYTYLSKYDIKADAIICSPPFVDSIRFYMQNWMRLWLCGWEATDFKNAETLFLDQKQKKDFDIYISFFEMCSKVLKPNGKVILHLGKTDKVDMAEELSKRASNYFLEVYRGSENVENVEKHGIKDKGATIEHQFLFLLKK